MAGRAACGCARMLLLLLPFNAATAAQVEWLILENPYFKAFASTDERRARELLEELDQFRVAVQIVTDLRIPEGARRTEILILGSDFNELAASRSIGGFAMGTKADAAGRIGTLIVIPADKIGANERVVVRHEYVHVLNAYRPLRFPRWYEEGSAEVFAHTTVRDGRTIVIDVPAGRIRNFKRSAGVGLDSWKSFDSIVAEQDPGSGGMTDLYLQYWLLTHYLVFGNPALAPQLEKSLIYFDAGMPALDAFTKAFGRTPESFWNGELSRYRRKIRSTHYTLNAPIAGAPFAARRDDEGEGEAALLALRTRLGQPDATP